MTTMQLHLAPSAAQSAHWHPNANEWHYVVKGRTRVTLFGPDKHLATADLGPGDCAYIPRACLHTIKNTGSEPCEIVGILDSGDYQRVLLFDWLSMAPPHLLANNFGIPRDGLPGFAASGEILAG